MRGLRKKILLVDDVSFFLHSTNQRLKTYHEIYTAQSADAMYGLLGKISPDLILLDIKMPEVSGYDIIQKLKDNPLYSYIPIIFVTSKDDKDSIIKGMELGAADYITKPFDIEELIGRIDDVFNSGYNADDKARIMVVDDCPNILKTINHLLGNDYVLYVTTKPENVRNMLKKMNPDLFLLDCNMPVLSGFDLVTIIRDIPGHEDTPILFLTADGTKDNLLASVNVGINDFLVKPIDEMILREKLLHNLENYLVKRRVREIIKNA